MYNKKYTCAICAVNSKYIHSSLAPWCLMAGVEQWGIDGIETYVIETTINAPQEELIQKLKATAPQAVALSCYIWNIQTVRQMLPKIRAMLPGCTIILGGPEVSYNPNEVLKQNKEADYVLCGEGEKPLALLLNYLSGEKNAKLCDVPGVCHNENINTEIVPYTPAEIPPSPYSPQYFAALGGRIAYLETSRGCPYSCAFCLSGRCGKVRFYSQSRAKAEMLLLANSGTKTVKLVDRTFNCNEKRANELWQFIIDNYGNKIPQGVCFHFEIAGDILTQKSLAILASAPSGSIQLEIGMQSFNEPTLAAVNRKTDTKRLCQNIKKLLQNGNIHVHIDLIAGLPLEDYDTFENSFNIGYNLHAHMLQLGFLKLLYGAQLRQTADSDGCVFNSEPPYEILYNKYLSTKDLEKLHLVEDALERFCNSGRFETTLNAVFENISVTPFQFYLALGSATAQTQGISLDLYIQKVFEFLQNQPWLNKQKIRDAMVCDRLATNSTGRLPPCLKITDDNLKKAVLWLSKNKPCQSAVRRGVAILYTGEKRVVYVDYKKENQNKVTKKWPLNEVPFSALDL